MLDCTHCVLKQDPHSPVKRQSLELSKVPAVSRHGTGMGVIFPQPIPRLRCLVVVAQHEVGAGACQVDTPESTKHRQPFYYEGQNTGIHFNIEGQSTDRHFRLIKHTFKLKSDHGKTSPSPLSVRIVSFPIFIKHHQQKKKEEIKAHTCMHLATHTHTHMHTQRGTVCRLVINDICVKLKMRQAPKLPVCGQSAAGQRCGIM